eukprot:g4777.t1
MAYASTFTPPSQSSSCSTAIVPYSAPLLGPLLDKERRYSFPELSPAAEIVLQQRWREGGSGTGSAAWAASHVLSALLCRGAANLARDLRDAGSVPPAWLLSAPAAWRGLFAVELGAGLGLVSIVAARLGMGVLATDGDEATLPLLRVNLELNGVAEGAAGGGMTGDGGGAATGAGDAAEAATTGDETSADIVTADQPPAGRVREQLLAWGGGGGGGDSKDRPAVAPKLVLAADVVYGEDVSVWKALLATLCDLAGCDTLVLIAQTARYPDKERVFFRLLQRRFACVALPQAALDSRFAGRKTADGVHVFSVHACIKRG